MLSGGLYMTQLEILPIEGLPKIEPGDDIIGMLGDCGEIRQLDILVVTQKIISKSENQLVSIDPNDPLSHKPLVERESVRILRRRGELIISETKHGFVCANAGIDLSNVERGQAALLPEDSDRSAQRLRAGLMGRYNLDVAVIISDTFGRPWRKGLTDVAIGSAGILPILDLRGEPDALGREMQVTEVALVDELARAAELVMGKSSGIPVAIIRGGEPDWFGDGNVRENLIRDPQDDLFR
ncbi:MAG: coenzyme F420-0:L-glutamate ligase [Acidimicrobiaceae bacterium]|nr:coenzyme F420-0:L-glutamate ligase [Acidimicrobiaceae bacterium]